MNKCYNYFIINPNNKKSMKKILFFAATAMLFAACANEEALAPQTAEVAANAISFDTYTASATRAGDAGVMTTDKLKEFQGFGVFAMYQDNADYASATAPNFMFNEHVSWTSGAWTYPILKYWPNETTNDSQADPNPATAPALDKLSFFAYAPYVALSNDGSMVTNIGSSTTVDAYNSDPAEKSGIMSYSKEDHVGDPLVEWKFTKQLDNNVDLLWGVAPQGLSYQAVNGTTINTEFGKPIVNMVKPDKDQKIKFLFEHALSRISLSVVSAIDQIAAGDDGNKFDPDQTRVLIKSVEIYGDFGKQGVLNLNNGTAHVANWIAESIDKHDVDGAKLFEITTTNGYMNADLRYVDAQITAVNGSAAKFAELNTGVLPSEQTLLAGGPDPSKKVKNPSFVYGTKLYKYVAPDYVLAKGTIPSGAAVYNKEGDDYIRVYDGSDPATGYEVSGAETKSHYTLVATPSDDTDNKIANGAEYYELVGNDYIKKTNSTGGDITGGSPNFKSVAPTEVTPAYAAGYYYTSLMPRYYMVIPTGDTPIKVKITYAVVTKDEKLTGNISNVENVITKESSLNLENGKSYNLKLILGLTSVKLDATVADWQVDGSNEVWLPKNNE